ncbi:B-(1-6) glucan synthase [Meira miltonrushii]|uniref:glucan endo-1,3-beta-D-glucosidase n=1 Tax=Meira miltonrushii TaxID=1280837 RepID=A0A316VQ57_9BASI|nr:B-(1-6) glucan synthase [Meira miltonrushii]PWN37625.1 B-(1-6) glucan synthase [Meira miltonrushii]
MKQNNIATKTSASTHPTSVATTNDADDCTDETTSFPTVTSTNSSQSSCFPALGFNMPSNVPSSLDGWWCSPTDEYAFLGFSYEISACQSQSQLIREFKDARNTFNARYVRLYGACDDTNYYGKVVEAAWQAGIGIHALIWFGFDGDNKWIGRRDSLFSQLHSNPKAKFVTRGVQFGSEPLYDWVMSGTDLAKQVKSAQANLKDLSINVTVSDMAYGYQSQQDSGSQDVLDAIDFVDAHMLPYFAQDASTGDKAWHDDANDMNYFLQHTSNKKIYWSENGWPSTHDCNAGVCPNSPNAVSSVASEQAYYDLLDSKCSTMKTYPQGGVGWFAHIYSDSQEPGYGIYDVNGKLKFNFKPRTSC